jgi:hypothetical protein
MLVAVAAEATVDLHLLAAVALVAVAVAQPILAIRVMEQ